MATAADFYGFRGRFNRAQFSTIVFGGFALLLFLPFWLFTALPFIGRTPPEWASIAFIYVALGLWFLGFAAAIVKRLRDMDMNPGLATIIIVLHVLHVGTFLKGETEHFQATLVMCLVIDIGLALWPGTKGTNRFGPDPAGRLN